jgi:hypothetical protein
VMSAPERSRPRRPRSRAQARDDAVACGNRQAPARPRRILGDDSARRRRSAAPARRGCGVVPVDAAAEHGDGHPPASRRPRCASPSTPRASPLTTTTPAAQAPRAATERPGRRRPSSTGADDRDAWQRQDVGPAAHEQRGGWIVKLASRADSPGSRRDLRKPVSATSRARRRAVGERLRDVVGADFGARERGDRSRHARNASSAASRRAAASPPHGSSSAAAGFDSLRRIAEPQAQPRHASERRDGRLTGRSAQLRSPVRAEPAPRDRIGRAAPRELVAVCSERCGEQEHSAAGSPRPPQGTGSSSRRARTEPERALFPAREQSRSHRPREAGEALPAPAGRTPRARPGKRTPWWARLASPGCGPGPPPTIAAVDAVW